MLLWHGAWLAAGGSYPPRLALWAEAIETASMPGAAPGALVLHPFAADHERLARLLAAVVPRSLPAPERWQVVVRLPTVDGRPVCSGTADPAPATSAPRGWTAGRLPAREPGWQQHAGAIGWAGWTLPALAVPPAQAAELLLALPALDCPRRAALGDDLRAWIAAARYALCLLARGRVRPALEPHGAAYAARWRPLLDDPEEQAQIAALARSMPAAGVALVWQVDQAPAQPDKALRDFLEALVDAVARQAAPIRRRPPPGAVGAWFLALAGEPLLRGRPEELDALYRRYRARETPAEVGGARLCLRLEPPEAAAAPHGAAWALRYFLQAVDDPILRLRPGEVWRHERWLPGLRGSRDPRELLLGGLGRAARLFPPLAAGLRAARPVACPLTAEQALAFVREAALALEAQGIGVLVPVLPATLALRARLQPQADDDGGVRLFTQERLVRFDWRVALGDALLTRQEFEALARLKEPLVQVRGRWVELRRDEVERALAFFARHAEQGALGLADALKLALAPEEAAPDLDTAVEAGGWLDELLGGLRPESRPAPLPEPPGFVGTLRPYQRAGVAWLAALRRHGLGACLADDMGLGKCFGKDTEIFLNGTLMRADEAWERFAGPAESDGEGEWALPTSPLLTNALMRQADGERVVPAPVRRLYRQYVKERLRRVRLDDGSEVLITQRHRLLGVSGWTTEIRPGDHVAVPSRLAWTGEDFDPDLVSLLAWQIAEGYEGARGALSITQSDLAVLERLRAAVQRLAERHALAINAPRIHSYPPRAAYLQINSVGYQRFVEGMGYRWGRRSAEKTIPDAIVAASDDTVRLFLREYLSAEGSVSRGMRMVEVVSASGPLMRQLSLLLRRFGVWLRIKVREKRATNGTGIARPYAIGLIGGPSLRRFCAQVGFSDARKQGLLEEVCRASCNTNVEGIPGGHLLMTIQRATGLPMRHFGLRTVYFRGTQQLSRESAAVAIAGLDRIISRGAAAAYRGRPRSKWTARVTAAYAALDTAQLRESRSALAGLVERDAFYCRVAAVEEVDYEGWVYDFEVDRHHNLVAGGILCHNTVQLIALHLHQPPVDAAGSAAPALVVCPTSVVGNWRRELARFAPGLRVLVHHGARRQREAFAAAARGHDVVISSYALLHRDEAALAAVQWGDVILDEAQNIKNPATKAAQVAGRLPARWRCALTGTPVENRLAELWSIFQFLNPGYLGSAEQFRKRFAWPIERGQDAAATARLKALVAPFILRRVKTDPAVIQDLPEKNEMKVYCTLTREQATLYEAGVRDAMRQIAEAEGLRRRGLILALLTKLKQVCDHPALLLHDRSALAGRSGKLERLREMLEEVEAVEERALIFTQYAEMGGLLREHLAATFGREVLFLHGGTPAEERDRMVARFQGDEDGPRLLVLSIKAGGTGLNLTRANHVFHFDRWWNPAVEDQATDRAYRIGQRRDVQVHKLICAGTMEELLDELIGRKVALAQAVVGGGETWLTELSTEELHSLVALRGDDEETDE